MRATGTFWGSTGAAALAAGLLWAAPALAQTADPAVQTAAVEDTGGLEDIIVTAQRRAENIQDVSIAIQAITAEGLARSGITDVTRLDLISPGVTFGRYGADAKISLRGANSNNTFLDSSPSVGVFVDGVYRPRAAQQTRAFFDVQRLEILKGPQGTLYGRNTLAGAVNLWTNVPDPDAFAAGATLSYARFNTVKTEGFVNVPLSDRFAVRLAGLFERGDGYVENLAGPNLGNPDTVSLRGSARYEGPGGDATLRVTNIRERGNQTGLFAQSAVCRRVTPQGLTDPFGTVTDCQNPRRGSAIQNPDGSITRSRPFDQLSRTQVLKDFVHEDEIDEFNVTLDVNLPLSDNLTARGVFSYTDFYLSMGQDGDFSEVNGSRDFLRENVESFTNELQLTYDDKERFKITVGGYASKDDIKFLSTSFRATRDTTALRPLIAVPGFPGTNLPRLDGTPVTNSRIDVGNPLILNAAGRQTREGQSSNNFQYLDVVSLGLFGQGSFELFDGFRIVGGVRYSRDEKDAVNYGGGAATTTYVGPQFPLTAPTTTDNFSTDPALAITTTKRDYENVTWRAAVEYDINPDVLLFAQVSTGFLSGSLSTAGTTTDDQESINYEGGIKSRFFDNRVQVNASVYYTEYTNLITSFQRVNNSGAVDTISINGGAIKATGAELIIEARPVENLRLTAAFSYLDAEFGVFSVLTPFQLVNGNPTATGRFVNLAGVTPQFSPDFTASIVAAYDIDLGDAGKITPQIQFYYSGKYSAQTQVSFLDPVGTQPSFTKTDLRLAWTSADERFGIEGFIENVEDEVVLQRVTYGGEGIEQAVFGYPQNYGVRLRGRF